MEPSVAANLGMMNPNLGSAEYSLNDQRYLALDSKQGSLLRNTLAKDRLLLCFDLIRGLESKCCQKHTTQMPGHNVI